MTISPFFSIPILIHVSVKFRQKIMRLLGSEVCLYYDKIRILT